METAWRRHGDHGRRRYSGSSGAERRYADIAGGKGCRCRAGGGQARRERDPFNRLRCRTSGANRDTGAGASTNVTGCGLQQARQR